MGQNCSFHGKVTSSTYYMAESLSSYSYPLDTAFLTPRSCHRARSALYTGEIMLCLLSKQQVQVRITCACCWKWKIKYCKVYRKSTVDIKNKGREICKRCFCVITSIFLELPGSSIRIWQHHIIIQWKNCKKKGSAIIGQQTISIWTDIFVSLYRNLFVWINCTSLKHFTYEDIVGQGTLSPLLCFSDFPGLSGADPFQWGHISWNLVSCPEQLAV